MQEHYIYGASVQGIQGYIFETGKLKEIAGASEIVEQICTDYFEGFLKNECQIRGQITLIRKAAGNIRLICDKADAEKIVKYFPKSIQENFPGLSISQALVKYTGQLTNQEMDLLEKKLNFQRNKPIRPYLTGISAAIRAPRTGRIAYKRNDDKELIDRASWEKLQKGTDEAHHRLTKKFLDENKGRFPFDFSEIIHPGCKWLAVIHADGNNLGKILQSLGKSLKNYPGHVADGYREFSECLDRATTKAAKTAFEKTFQKSKEKVFPFRPIILGGDDFTVVCRADMAIEFTQYFLEEFEKETKEHFKGLVQGYSLEDFQDGLTACAGIAFIKESYPFHYGYHLAEELCAQAKKASKKIPGIPSSLAFHKILSSFYDDYEETKKRELTASPKDNQDKPIHFDFGPYAINKNTSLPCIQDLRDCVKTLEKKDAPKSGLRRWLSEIHHSELQAKELIQRVAQIAKSKEDFQVHEFDESIKKLGANLSLGNPMTNENKTPLFDILTLLSWEGEQ
ncbi:MAG: hypothetical protein HUU50_17700 [Candidatus Brocadiae bacterium]|nr:hypothetical protein [Candidatus Brocadiia bacterium]